VRVKVIYDKQANGVAPTAVDVFAVDSFYSPNNLDNADRFVTLADFITPPMSVANEFCVSGKSYTKINLDTLWTSTAGNIANVKTGSIYLLACQNGNAGVAAPTFTYYSRVRYQDP